MIKQIGRLIIELRMAKSGTWTYNKGEHISHHIVSVMYLVSGRDTALSFTIGKFNMSMGLVSKESTKDVVK